MSPVETEILEKIYAAINLNDVPAALAHFDAHATLVEMPGFPSAGTYQGQAAVGARLQQGRATWAEGACEPEEFQEAAGRIIALVHVHVRLKERDDWINARIADVYTFRNGSITEMRTFVDARQALAWAGAQAQS